MKGLRAVCIGEKGFTLIEVTVALVLLAVALVPMMNAVYTSQAHLVRARQTQQATHLAQAKMEEICDTDFNMITAVDEPVSFESEGFLSARGFRYTLGVTGSEGCKVVTVTVFLPGSGNARPVSLSGVVYPW